MKREGLGAYVFIFALATSIVLVILLSNDAEQRSKEIIIEGRVVDASMDDYWMVITFDNNESYRIHYEFQETLYDFTVNSKMIIKLTYFDCILLPNTNDVWDVDTMIKVDENPGELE